MMNSLIERLRKAARAQPWHDDISKVMEWEAADALEAKDEIISGMTQRLKLLEDK